MLMRGKEEPWKPEKTISGMTSRLRNVGFWYILNRGGKKTVSWDFCFQLPIITYEHLASTSRRQEVKALAPMRIQKDHAVGD